MKTTKKILLIYKNQILSKVFEENLCIEGYEVEALFKEPFQSFNLNNYQKIINIIQRIIFKKNTFPLKADKINFKNFCKKSLHKLKNEKFDYCLVIRGDLIPEFVLKHARSISGKMIDYQLDGLSVSSKILEYEKYFDRIFVFDPEDIKRNPSYNLEFLPNCYFGETDFTNPAEIDLLYIGQFLEKRHQQLFNIHNYLEAQQLYYTSHTSLYQGRDFIPLHSKILHHKISTTYQENLNFVKNAKTIIDFKRDEHDGLSLRFFEAMQFGRKIITDNSSVKNYDFYHPKNIFITDFINFDGLVEFIEKPYQTLPKEITEKYSFRNWIKIVLGEKK